MSTTDSKILARALTYAKSLGGLVIGHPQDPGLSMGASATSGPFASLKGLPHVSPMAERMGIDRDIALIEMTGVRYHFDQITTARALPAFERAKANGFDVTAGVSIHHLTLNEFDIGDYRSFFKVKPPLRSEDDRRAVVEAVAAGLIDVICRCTRHRTRKASACRSRKRPQARSAWKQFSRPVSGSSIPVI